MSARVNTGKFAPRRLPEIKTAAVCLSILAGLALYLILPASPVLAAMVPASPAPVPATDTSAGNLSLQEQPEPAPPNPLIYLDIWLFGGLVLLVALIVGIKYLWKALQPDNRDPSEGLQPWERPDYDDE